MLRGRFGHRSIILDGVSDIEQRASSIILISGQLGEEHTHNKKTKANEFYEFTTRRIWASKILPSESVQD